MDKHPLPPRRAPYWPMIQTGVLAAVILAAAARSGTAQVRSRPRYSYYAAVTELCQGDYRRAERAFRAELRSGAIRSPQSRWIDSICYFAMLGECYYQAGHYRPALEQYDAALELYLAFSNWMLRVQFPPAVRPDVTRAQRLAPWGRSARTAQPGSFPNTMLVSQGRIDNSDVVQHGGVVRQAIFFPINVQEIVRCTALAIRRRRALLGPVAKYDSLTDDLLATLSRRPGPPNHWSEAWIDVQLGLAYALAQNPVQAQRYLVRSLLAGERYDHPLTCVALLELGRLAVEAGDLRGAAKFFAEAGYSAYQFDNLGVLEESFRWAVRVHLLAGKKGLYPPLAVATAWAKAKRLRQLQAWLTLLSAENDAAIGQPRQADLLLGQTRGLVGRRDMGSGRLGGQLHFQMARVAFQLGHPELAASALHTAMAFAQTGSQWLFHIALADARYVDGSLSPRIAMLLYDRLLRDPAPADWSNDPYDSLAVLVTPHRAVFEHWFDAALKRKEANTAFAVADLARRHDFLSSLPMGGRLLALRWLLETPPDQLDHDAVLQRQDLLVRYPDYTPLAQQARAVRTRLAGKPLVPTDPKDRTHQRSDLAELVRISLAQEAILKTIALAREPAALSFPPRMKTKDLMDSMADGQAVLAMFAARGTMHAFLLTNQNYRVWKIDSPQALRRRAVELLHVMGNHDANRELNLATLGSSKWRQPARQVLDQLLKGSRIDLTKGIQELIIVPSDFLWYVPFEALIAGKEQNGGRTLLDRMRIRYLPTAGLALPDRAPARPLKNTAVVLGKLFPRDAQAVAQAAFNQIKTVVPTAVAIQAPLPAPSPVFGSLLDALIVLEDISPAGAYGWAPIPLDRPAAAGALRQWFPLPWGGPRWIVLPGFHTIAETGLKGHRHVSGKNDLFLTLCGLMSCGARTVLISRWRVGGQTSSHLVREFVQELPHTRAPDAWQRSVQLNALEPIDWQREPRVQRLEVEVAPMAAHPFFWAAYMLVDRGPSAPRKEPAMTKPPAKPVLKFKGPAKLPKQESKKQEFKTRKAKKQELKAGKSKKQEFKAGKSKKT